MKRRVRVRVPMRWAVALVSVLLGPLLMRSAPASALGHQGSGIKVLTGSPYDFVAPEGIVAVEGDLWVADENGIVEVRAATGGLIRHIAVYGGVISIATSGAVVWTGQGGPYGPSKYQSIRAWNASTGALIRQIDAPQDKIDDPLGITVAGPHLWVANFSTTTSKWYVTELDATHGTLVRTISSHVTGPDAVAVGGGHLWVQDSLRTLTVYSESTGAYLRTIALPYSRSSPPPQGGGMVVSGASLWVPMGQWLDVVSLKTDKVTSYKYSTAVMTAGDCQQFPAISGSAIWIANCDHQSVTEIALSDGKLLDVVRGPAYSFENPVGLVPYDGSLWVTNQAGEGGIPGGSVTEFPLP